MNHEKWYGLTLYELLEKACGMYVDKNLFVYMERGEEKKVSYRKFLKDVHTVAGHFDTMDLRGKYVAIEGRQEYEVIVAMYATVSVGAIAVMLNLDMSQAEVDRAFLTMPPALLVIGEDNYELVEEYANKSAVSCVLNKGEGATIRNWIENEKMSFSYFGGAKPEDPALVLLTSGSTSLSKYVLLSHYAFLPRKEFLTEKCMLLFPLYHVAGISVLQLSICFGIEMCISNMKDGIRDMGWFHPTEVVSVPAFTSLLVNRSKQGLLNLDGFECIYSGAAPQNMETVEYLTMRNIATYSSYGATELGGTVTYSSRTEIRNGTVGKPGTWNEIKLSDEGEILVRGKNVMLGYIGNEKETKEAIRDGWYHTGDVGRFDEEGFLSIVGRIKNIIILSNGENVSPEAIEAQLNMCEDIDEVVVKGEDDMIVAHIWCGENATEETCNKVEKYIKIYNRSVPSYHRVQKTVFRKEPFEKTSTGKIKRV